MDSGEGVWELPQVRLCAFVFQYTTDGDASLSHTSDRTLIANTIVITSSLTARILMLLRYGGSTLTLTRRFPVCSPMLGIYSAARKETVIAWQKMRKLLLNHTRT